MSRRQNRLWTRGDGLVLLRLKEAPASKFPVGKCERFWHQTGSTNDQDLPSVEWYAIQITEEYVGVLALKRNLPQIQTATIFAIEIIPEHRGQTLGMRALLIAEKKLKREGIDQCYSRVPRNNGRGFYFMLRAGHAPITPPFKDDDATWFLARPTHR